MGGDGGFVLPFFVKEQPSGIFAIGVDMVRNTARFGAGAGAMFTTQANDLIASGRLDREGCRNDNHSFSVARVVLFDMK